MVSVRPTVRQVWCVMRFRNVVIHHQYLVSLVVSAFLVQVIWCVQILQLVVVSGEVFRRSLVSVSVRVTVNQVLSVMHYWNAAKIRHKQVSYVAPVFLVLVVLVVRQRLLVGVKC